MEGFDAPRSWRLDQTSPQMRFFVPRSLDHSKMRFRLGLRFPETQGRIAPILMSSFLVSTIGWSCGSEERDKSVVSGLRARPKREVFEAMSAAGVNATNFAGRSMRRQPWIAEKVCSERYRTSAPRLLIC